MVLLIKIQWDTIAEFSTSTLVVLHHYQKTRETIAKFSASAMVVHYHETKANYCQISCFCNEGTKSRKQEEAIGKLSIVLLVFIKNTKGSYCCFNGS